MNMCRECRHETTDPVGTVCTQEDSRTRSGICMGLIVDKPNITQCPKCGVGVVDGAYHRCSKDRHGTTTPLTAQPEILHHECGATSSVVPDLTQIPYSMLVLTAKRFMLGEKRHARNNWRKGVADKGYIVDRLNHIVRHCYHLAALINNEPADDTGDSMIDDAGAIAWGAAFLSVAVPEIEKMLQQTQNATTAKDSTEPAQH